MSGPRGDKTWETSVEKLKEWLESFPGTNSLAMNITQRLLQWKTKIAAPIQVDDTSTQRALHAQDLVGWHPFLQGILAQQWEPVLKNFTQQAGVKVSLKRWI